MISPCTKAQKTEPPIPVSLLKSEVTFGLRPWENVVCLDRVTVRNME